MGWPGRDSCRIGRSAIRTERQHDRTSRRGVAGQVNQRAHHEGFPQLDSAQQWCTWCHQREACSYSRIRGSELARLYHYRQPSTRIRACSSFCRYPTYGSIQSLQTLNNLRPSTISIILAFEAVKKPRREYHGADNRIIEEFASYGIQLAIK